jgi:ribonuclease HI
MGGIMLVPASADPHHATPTPHLTRLSTINPATLFIPFSPRETPETHFPLQTLFHRCPFPRFINRYNSHEILLAIDGSCLNNGRAVDPAQAPVAGCSFVYKLGVPSSIDGSATITTGTTTTGTPTTLPFVGGGEGITGKVGFRLEQRGPRDDLLEHTSNRAKLRAVIAALDFRAWHGEGWRRVVIATDLEYIVYGATQWLPIWVLRRWRTQRGRGIANRDLWEELQARIEYLREYGTEVSFWLVPSHRLQGNQFFGLLGEAKSAAREAARIQPEETTEQFTKLCGLLV